MGFEIIPAGAPISGGYKLNAPVPGAQVIATSN
jgi:hypothetical protein